MSSIDDDRAKWPESYDRDDEDRMPGRDAWPEPSTNADLAYDKRTEHKQGGRDE